MDKKYLTNRQKKALETRKKFMRVLNIFLT